MNRYKQLKVIGEGAFGRAILVEDRDTGNRLVMKVIKYPYLALIKYN